LPSPPLQERGAEGEGVEDDALLQAFLAAYPDRLARRREPGSRKGVMVGGRGVRLASSSGGLEPELFLCLDVDAGQTESLVRLASGVERDWLPPDRVKTSVEVDFDAATERVAAWKRLRFDDLVLEETQAALPRERAAEALIAA